MDEKQIVVIIGAYYFANYIQNFIQLPALKVKSIRRGKFWGSSMWNLMQQFNCWSSILQLSNTWEKTVVQ